MKIVQFFFFLLTNNDTIDEGFVATYFVSPSPPSITDQNKTKKQTFNSKVKETI